MQRNKSQHHETLRDLLKTLTLLRKCLVNTLKNSSRYMLEGKIVLECKKRRIYPEAKQRHDLPSMEFPF
jgi:hypothetical protein